MPELIDKHAAYTALKHEEETHGLSFSAEAFEKAARIIDQMPTIEPEVRHGRWIYGRYDEYPTCSCCKQSDTYAGDYCGNCGTKMDLRTPTEVELDIADSVMMGGLTMAEKNCENCANEFCAFMPPNGKAYCDRWRSNAPAVNRWIPCSERLPEQGERVIVAIFGSDMIMPNKGETLQDAIERSRKEGYITVGFIGSDGWYGADWFPLMVQPSYWMPKPDLPEPPEKE